jgi:hypothetical protein
MSPIQQFMAWACAPPPIGAMICVTLLCAGPAGASTPTLTWDGVRRLGVQCQVDPDTLPDRRALQAALCDKVRALAADKAPIPVVLFAPGDPGVIAADTTVLLFHANVQTADAKGAPLLVFSLRAFRAVAAPSELFGAPPRAVALPSRLAATPQFDAAVTAALAQTLPWRPRQAP